MSENHDKFAMQSWPLRRYEFPMPVRYHVTKTQGPGTVFCFHGYQDHALSMIRRLGWWERADLPFQIAAINGPFPVPLWMKDGFREAYSWYFRDTSRELDFVSPQTTASRLKLLIDDLHLTDTPKVLFGFSMGGFLAPYLAHQLKNVRGIIGLGCGYNLDAYNKLKPLKVHAVHGDQDERIPLAQSQKDFAEILKMGHTGEFHLVPKLTHRVDESIEPLIRRISMEILS
jgi:predicted esterase